MLNSQYTRTNLVSPECRDLAGVLMLCYVIATVPLAVAFAVEADLWSIYFFIDMFVVSLTDCLCSSSVQLRVIASTGDLYLFLAATC